jgi:hypothetical protein
MFGVRDDLSCRHTLVLVIFDEREDMVCVCVCVHPWRAECCILRAAHHMKYCLSCVVRVCSSSSVWCTIFYFVVVVCVLFCCCCVVSSFLISTIFIGRMMKRLE